MTRYQVTFKGEYFMDGVPIGPCRVIDLDAAEADPLVKGSGLGVPYGYRPAWMEHKGWVSVIDAREIAAQYGVELEES